jgi:hypothetical protein
VGNPALGAKEFEDDLKIAAWWASWPGTGRHAQRLLSSVLETDALCAKAAIKVWRWRDMAWRVVYGAFELSQRARGTR